MGIIDTLKNAELFAGLETHHLKMITELCRGGSFKEGTMIFNEGDEATELYILTEGKVVLEMELRPLPDYPPIPSALEVVINGGCFGWSAIAEPYVYTLSARCMTNCTVLAIKGDMLRQAMTDDLSLGYEVMARLVKLVSLRLTHTRLRLTSGIGLILMGRELGEPK